MLELLIVSACLGGDDGCNQALKGYYEYNSAVLKPIVRKTRRKAEQLTSKEFLVLSTSISSLLINQSYQIKIGKKISLQGKKDSINLVYQIEF